MGRKCLLTRRENQYCSERLFRTDERRADESRPRSKTPPSAGRTLRASRLGVRRCFAVFNLTGAEVLELASKDLKNRCAIQYPLQRVCPGTAAKNDDVVHGGQRRFCIQRGRFHRRFRLFIRLLTRNVRCPVRSCAVWTGRPRDPRLARRIQPEQGDTVVVPKCITIQSHSTTCYIAKDNYLRFLLYITTRNGDCAIQFNCLHERPFPIVFLC